MEYIQFGQTDVAAVGARTPQQIEQPAPAASIHLETADLAEIERIMKTAASVGGPAPELM
jgi:aryl-alcohol dehydrogenase-like predicted oxidoreductase